MTKYNPFEKDAESYDNWFKKNRETFNSEAEALKKVFDREKSTIEIGAGTGLFSRELGIKTGLEPSEDMGRIAASRGIDIIKGFGENMPIKSGTYEQVVMITVECFLEDIDKTFDEINRILSDEGIFIIAFLNRESSLGEIYRKNQKDDPIYKWAEFKSGDEIKELLEAHGFIFEESYCTVTDFENKNYPVEEGYGNGVFTVFKAKKQRI